MKIKFLLGLVACFVSLASCNKEDKRYSQDIQEVYSFTSLTATIDEMASTRAYLGEGSTPSNRSVRWGGHEYIYVFSDEQPSPSVFTEDAANVQNVTFHGDEVKGNKFYAFYIGGNDYEISDESSPILNLSLNWVLQNENEYFTPSPMVATSTNNNFTFKQTTGLIHVEVGNVSQVTEVMFKGNNSEYVAGDGYVKLDEPSPVFRLYADDSHWAQQKIFVTYYGSQQELSLNETKDLYFIIPPQTFEHGFSITIKGFNNHGEEFSVIKSTNSKLFVDRGTVHHYKLIDVNATLEESIVKTKAALTALYNYTGGDNWTDNTNWLNFDVPYSEWKGLTVENGTIIEINLSDNNLSGTIPDEIGDLKNLKTLWLVSNNLTGVSDRISELYNLEVLGLSYNPLSKCPKISGLTYLRQLSMYNCNLTGALPGEIANLKSLEVLELSDNQFEGFIPDSWFTSLIHLYHLNLDNNNLDGLLTSQMQQSPMIVNILQDGRLYINKQSSGHSVVIEGAVTDLVLKQTMLTIRVGDMNQLEAPEILPENAVNKNYYWYVDDYYKQYVNITENGQLTGIGEGDAYVYVYANDGFGAMNMCYIKVVSADGSKGCFNAEGYIGEHGEW